MSYSDYWLEENPFNFEAANQNDFLEVACTRKARKLYGAVLEVWDKKAVWLVKNQEVRNFLNISVVASFTREYKLQNERNYIILINLPLIYDNPFFKTTIAALDGLMEEGFLNVALAYLEKSLDKEETTFWGLSKEEFKKKMWEGDRDFIFKKLSRQNWEELTKEEREKKEQEIEHFLGYWSYTLGNSSFSKPTQRALYKTLAEDPHSAMIKLKLEVQDSYNQVFPDILALLPLYYRRFLLQFDFLEGWRALSEDESIEFRGEFVKLRLKMKDFFFMYLARPYPEGLKEFLAPEAVEMQIDFSDIPVGASRVESLEKFRELVVLFLSSDWHRLLGEKKPPSEIFPFSDEALEETFRQTEGEVLDALFLLRGALELAVEKGAKKIGKSLINQAGKRAQSEESRAN
jgi:hypothetical protein